MERVHLDFNATTPLRPEAREALLEALDAGLGNASSVHGAGRRGRAAVDEARERVAAALGVPEDGVVFTGGGTEANNLALFGALGAGPPDMRLVTSTIEHAAVQAPALHLQAGSREVCWVGVDQHGALDLDALESAATGGPALVSVMGANNEIGSTTDLAEVRARIGDQAVFHSDSVQVLGKKRLDLMGSGVDLASLSAHKVGGPIGVGVLFRRPGAPIAPTTFGGAQEGELRPGTENVPAIVAAAVAIELAVEETDAYGREMARLTGLLWRGLRARLPGLTLNGPAIDDPTRLPNTLNISSPSGDARTLVARLDLEGVEVSAGSACASGSLEPSHVLKALGLDPERARSGLRISLGSGTREAVIHTCVERLGRTLGGAP